MLDNEPETDQQPDADQPTPAPRRRRAASRPAGPPAQSQLEEQGPAVAHLADTPAPPPPLAATQTEVPAPEQQQPEVSAVQESQAEIAAPDLNIEGTAPIRQTTARRTARKTTAKRATEATVPDEQAPDPAATEAPKKRAPRKRAVPKAADNETVALTTAAPADETATERPAGWAAPHDGPEEAALPGGQADAVASEDPGLAPVEQDEAEPAETRDFGWLANPFAPPIAEELDEDAVAGPEFDAGQSATAEAISDDAAAADTEPEKSDDDEPEDGGSRRRRRRRGGRRRRRSGADEDATDTEDESDDDSSAESGESLQRGSGDRPGSAGTPDADGADASEDEGEDSEGQRRRRRRRRRRGEEAAAAPDDPTDVVVRVREPRPRKRATSTEVTGIEGSTRMEAKRQRRREGRDAGRRRAPILSEAEFLARRESVSRKMIIRQRDDLAQIAVLEDGILVEHYVDRDSAASLIGNVYLGRVQNVLPSMEAAFVDIGRGRNAVLYAGEVDWDSFGADGHNRKVEKVLKSGQMILVQVSKDPVGAKGARLTNHVSIPGRYIVYAPGGHLSGISRKLPDIERRRLKDILADLVGESASVIVRTAAEGASEDELVRDVNRLKAQWEDIERKVKAGNSPQLLYGEPDLTVRIVRDLFTEDFSELVIQGNGSMNDAYDAIMGYVSHVAPHLQERIRRWEPTGEEDLFAEYRLDEQIVKALERKVFLPSGGSLVIDRTEAMTVIDVNTGKFTGAGGNLEATVTSNNLEAAEEVVRQLRLRDIGGIIVIDFIDMVLPNNRELLLRRLVECLGRDRTRHQVAEVTSLGLIQMTRKKIGTGLLEAFGTECPQCQGRGYELHDMPVETQQQADGGTREQRPRDYRSRGQDSGGFRGGTADKNGSESKNGSSRNESSSRSEAVDHHGVAEADASTSEGETTARSDRTDSGSRGRGARRGRGGSAQPENDSASTEEPSAPQPEPAPSP